MRLAPMKYGVSHKAYADDRPAIRYNLKALDTGNRKHISTA